MITENVELGNSETIKEKLTNKDIIVKDVTKEEHTIKKDNTKKDILTLWSKHPDNEQLIKLTKVKYLKGETLAVEGLWWTLDQEGKIAKQSAIGTLMRFYKINNPNQLIEKTLKTSYTTDGKYLVIKAYD